MMSSSDPRVHKPRLPKAYSEPELAFLKSHLPEFERRSQGSIRGDAKKFALERAAEFINTFGLPAEYQDVTEPEPRFREQIYNWYKNTIGRTRRKLEGRPRSSKKAAEKAAQNNITWPTNLATPTTVPYSQVSSSSHPIPNSSTVVTPQYGGSYQATTSTTSTSTSGSPSNLKLNINVSDLCDAFLTPAVDASTLSSMIQTSVMSNPSPTPLTTVIQVLFEAITIAQSSQSTSSTNIAYPNGDSSYQLLRRFLEACSYFPSTVSHANASGPLAGPRALQMAIRKASVWTPMGYNPSISSPPTMSHEMERIAIDRQRRKDYIQWARVHAAALELGMLGMNGDSNGQFVSGRSCSEVMARDSVWQEDEVEWCAGICVLRAIIRTGLRGGPGQRQEYEELLRTYEGKWKEIKDEARQAFVTEILLGAKDDLTCLIEQPHTT